MEKDALVRAASEPSGIIRESVWLGFEPVLGSSGMFAPNDPSPIDSAAPWQHALIEGAPERGPVVNKPLRPRLPPVATGPFRNLRTEARR
ncbi:hypothetical protein HNP00_000884 [Arthrobacter sp. AZCC_0090]|nr:hypothetical protein [Arthrobacter sp. AZCC_0090]